MIQFCKGWLLKKDVLCLVMEAVDPSEIAFREQFRLRGQPVLHLASGQRTFVHISEVGLSGHSVRCGRIIRCGLL